MLTDALNYTHILHHKMFYLKKYKLHWEETSDVCIS